jgi:16S rRNA (guanine527-N7)-methyltransferase
VEDRLTAAGGHGLGRSLKPIRGPEDFAEAFKVPRETIHRLITYAEIITEWQARHNLISAATFGHIWDRHFADSAQLLRLAPDAEVWLDLGAGAGFPGLVVAILQANQGTLRVHLVESTRKKCAFLAEVVRATSAPVEIHCMRIEELTKSTTSLRPEIVTARALAPLPRLLDLAAPWFAPGVRGLFLKGRDAAKEVEAAYRDFTFSFHLHPSLTSAESSIVEVRDVVKRRKATRR